MKTIPYILAALLGLAALGSVPDALGVAFVFAITSIGIVFLARRHNSLRNPEVSKSKHAQSPSLLDRLPAGDFATVAAESGFFVSPVPDWLVAEAESELADWQSADVQIIDRRIRQTGTLLNIEEKRALGISGNAKISRQFIQTLSQEGLKKPTSALVICLHRCTSARANAYSTASATLLSGAIDVKIFAAQDERTCAAARAIDGKKYSLEDAPALPLHSCDAQWCRCVYGFEPRR